MSNPTDYDTTLYRLNGLSNISSRHPGISDKDLGELITESLTGPLADWDICWGPHVTQAPNGKAINTMYAAKEKGQESYVIGIAGTNASSLFDWLWEDAFVGTQVPWIYAAQASAKIALGTASGLVILQTMTPDTGAAASGTTLAAFLQSLTDKRISVTIAGHSLGGALAPTLALWLRDTQGFPGLWDPAENATVTTMPFAGPTAGDARFAAHSDEMLPHAKQLPSDTPASYRYANSLDIAPYVWNEGSLDALRTLYQPDIPENTIIDNLVKLAMDAASDGDYTQLTPPDPPWAGTIDQSRIKPPQPPLEEIDGFLNYLRQAVYQHTQAYDEYFGLDAAAFQSPPSQISVSPTVEKLVKEAGGSLPSDVTVSSEPMVQQMVELAIGRDIAKRADAKGQVDALVAAMRRSGSAQ